MSYPTDVEYASVHSYQNEVIVELAIRDADDDLVVYSYQFEYLGENGAVSPKQSVDERFERTVTDALSDHGYRWK